MYLSPFLWQLKRELFEILLGRRREKTSCIVIKKEDKDSIQETASQQM
jgi:hypothetical protein